MNKAVTKLNNRKPHAMKYEKHIRHSVGRDKQL